MVLSAGRGNYFVSVLQNIEFVIGWSYLQAGRAADKFPDHVEHGELTPSRSRVNNTVVC